MEEVDELPESNAELEDIFDLDSVQTQCDDGVSHDINSSPGSDQSDHSDNELEKDFCSHETEEQASGNFEQSGTFRNLDCSDPALWPRVVSDDHRKLLVEKGPCRINYEYPTDENGRRFLERYYV